MLTRLHISNYALIDSLDLEPGGGLSIITGETGAGKSIMLGALALLLGDRADTGVITDKERKTVVEAVFSGLTEEAAVALSEIDADVDGELIVRREINPKGRSRAFINDTPVTLAELASVTRCMVDIHSQHSNLMLSKGENQLALVDAYAGDADLLEDYRNLFARYVDLRKAIERERNEVERNRANKALYSAQLEELDALAPKEGELEEVERRFDILSDAEEIREHLYAAYSSLSGEEGAALARVADAVDELSRVDMELFEPKSPLPKVEIEGLTEQDFTLVERLRQVSVELKDIAETVAHYASDVEADPGELSRVSSRMNKLYEARRRFHVDNADQLVTLREDLRRRLASLDGSAGNLPELESEARACARLLREKGEGLTAVRRNAADGLAAEIADTVRSLGMPNLKFEIAMTPAKLSRHGGDALEFRCSFNKNMPMQNMTRIASGGETARLMLAIKGVMARRMNMPTLIFDEIDTGVSGEIAGKMGALMHRIADSSQVIAITHLPQVAAKGERHFKVFKRDGEARTYSDVRLLDHSGRVEEIASMISGETLTPAAVEAARTLLDSK